MKKNSISNSEKFFEAAEGGDISLVSAFLEAGIDPNLQDEMGRTALYLASEEGHLEIVKLLLKKGAGVNTIGPGGFRALDEASLSGHFDVVKFLIENGAKENRKVEHIYIPLYWPTLYMSTERGTSRLAIVRYLLNRGENPNATSEEGRTALHEASFNGHLEIVKILIEKGVNVNAKAKDGSTSLHEASKEGFFDVVEFLIEKGADIEVQDKQGRTPLHEAARRGQLKAVAFLIQKWANIHALNDYADIVKHLSGSYTLLEVDRLLKKLGAKGAPPLSIVREISKLLKKRNKTN